MSAIDNIPQLLELISIQAENSSSDFKNPYNIFEVLGVEYNEVIVCRFIGNLLDPQGGHGLGAEPLRLFIGDVLGADSLDEDLEKAVINLEEHINNDRRVDIVIHLQKKVYPIEVKIWAGDQNKQLEDYYRSFFGDSEQDKIYYLTPNGRKPSDESRGELSPVRIKPISFSEQIKTWLDDVQKIATGKIKFVIENFMEVIEKMNRESDELNKVLEVLELNEEACDTPEIKSAILLLKYPDKIWDRIRRNFIRKIISLGEGYALKDCEEKEKDIPHALMYVEKGNDKIACICVDTNLYIVVKKKRDTYDKDWVKFNSDYQWKYMDNPNKSKEHIQLKHPTELPEISTGSINIEELLR